MATSSAPQRSSKFYEYYQVYQPEIDVFESEDKGESTYTTVGMHSPWGLEAIIAEKFGYTREYILHGTAFSNLMMMLADSPQTIDKKEQVTEASDDDLQALSD